ncbi:hypothetical protein LC607_31320 [Nostoc sp. CHAB 5824]|nr:hypothetical protein [Nostoc sp. CHAB 5824]
MGNCRGSVFFDLSFHSLLDIDPFWLSLVVNLVFPKPEDIFHQVGLAGFNHLFIGISVFQTWEIIDNRPWQTVLQQHGLFK